MPNGNILIKNSFEREVSMLLYTGDYDNGFMDLQESINFIDGVKNGYKNTKELKEQWRKVADTFVKHKWIYRYITPEQKDQLEKHYAVLTADKPFYSSYKRSFKFICKFMGLPDNMVIIENMIFTKDKQDKNQWEIALKYSKGLVKVKIPDGVRLIHVSPVPNLKELIPTFKSKTVGKYMYPTRRVFFTVAKDIKPNKAGLEGQTTTRYTPKQEIKTVYIDPTYSEFRSGAVYVETDIPIPVETLDRKWADLLKRK